VFFFSLLQKVVLLWFKCFWLKDSLVLSSSFSLFFSLVRFSLSLLLLLSFFLFRVVCSVLSDTKKKTKTHEKKCFSSVCSNNTYWNIFSTVLVSFIIKRNNLNTPFARWWCRA